MLGMIMSKVKSLSSNVLSKLVAFALTSHTKFYKRTARMHWEQSSGWLTDNHECQLLAKMGIDDFAHITAKSEEDWKALSPA